MSFGKAKRFNYKPVDPTPSPADYAICSKFDKGHFISRCARFSNLMRDEKCTFVICPTSANHHGRCSTPNSEENCMRDNLDTLKRKIIEFNRHDLARHSFRRKSSRSNNKNSTTQSKYKSNNLVNLPKESANEEQCLYESEGYFDEDYDSFTSSEELDNLKKVEEYEFNEVCKAFQRMQTRNSKRQKRISDFEEIVLKKLENIENNVEDFKDEFEKLYQNNFLQNSIGGSDLDTKQELYYPLASEIENTIKRTIENVEDEFEKNKKSILHYNTINIKKLINEIHASSEKSSDQIRKLCKKTAEKLSKNVKVLVKNNVISTVEFPCEIENISIAEEAHERNDKFSYENICKVLSHHLQETQDANDILENDYMDLSTKYSGTQQMLDVQGALIEVLKDELADLKQSLYKKNK